MNDRWIYALKLLMSDKDNSSFHVSLMYPGWMNLHRNHDVKLSTLKALVNRGLVEHKGGLSVGYRITSAGRDALLNALTP